MQIWAGNMCINIFLRQTEAEWELRIGWKAEGRLSKVAKPMGTTSSWGFFHPTLLSFLPLDFRCPPTAHVPGLFVSFGFDPCLPYFRAGFIKCLSASFRASSLSLPFKTLAKWENSNKRKASFSNSQWSGWPQLSGGKEPEDNSKWSQGLH